MTRDEFRSKFVHCFICGSHNAPDVHEIARGPNRQKSLESPSTWIKTCRMCHVVELPGMPIARQLAYKMIHDPENYDRAKVNVLRRRSPDAVSEQDVAVEISKVFRAVSGY